MSWFTWPSPARELHAQKRRGARATRTVLHGCVPLGSLNMFEGILSTLVPRFAARRSRKARRPASLRKRAERRLAPESLEGRMLMSGTPTTAYLQTNLISDQDGVAQITDSSLVNAWGHALPPTTGNFWIADNETGVSSVYGGHVNRSALTKKLGDVTIPGGSPTGVVFNSTSDFVVDDGN